MRSLSDTQLSWLLAADVPAVLATLDGDGFPYPTPIWFVWADGAFWASSGPGRPHVRNLQADPRAAIVVEVEGQASPAGRPNMRVKGRGLARVLPHDPDRTVEIGLKYLAGDAAEAERRAASDRVTIQLRPERLLAAAGGPPWPQARDAMR